MKHTLRSKGQFATRKQYAQQAVLSGLTAVGVLHWARMFFIFAFLVLYSVGTEPHPIEYVRAEAIPPVASSTPIMIEVRIDWTRERIDQEIEKQAAKYGKDAEHLKKIVECESGYDTDIQSGHMLSYGREQSYGLAQIHLPSHPNVTYEQAIDPQFAIEFLAKNYGKVKWSCSKLI